MGPYVSGEVVPEAPDVVVQKLVQSEEPVLNAQMISYEKQEDSNRMSGRIEERKSPRSGSSSSSSNDGNFGSQLNVDPSCDFDVASVGSAFSDRSSKKGQDDGNNELGVPDLDKISDHSDCKWSMLKSDVKDNKKVSHDSEEVSIGSGQVQKDINQINDQIREEAKNEPAGFLPPRVQSSKNLFTHALIGGNSD